MDTAALLYGLLTEFLPQLTLILVAGAAREIYRSHEAISRTQELAKENRQELESVKQFIIDEHDLEVLKG